MRFDLIVTTLAAASLAACTPEAPEGELPFEGDAGELGKADGVSVSVTELNADIDMSRFPQGGTFIITSKKAWTRVMGTNAPADVNFAKEWVAFFGTGIKNTGGFSAQITDLRYHPGAGALVLSTHATSPGSDCIVTQAFTNPHHVVKLTIPSPRPLFALADRSSEVRRCSPSNAERLVELEDSLRAWDAAKLANNNTYTYVRDFSSFSGFAGQTTIVVEAGVVTERHYKAGHVSGEGEHVQWSELGAQVGSHTDEGHPAVLVDELYKQCRTDVLTQDEDENFMSFSLDQRGLLQACTYFPIHCNDDCSRGPTISELIF